MRTHLASSASNRPHPPPTHHLELFTELTNVKDVTKALLHVIFFHRLFIAVRPLTRDIVFHTPSSISSTRIGVNQPHSRTAPPTMFADPPTITYPLVDDADFESTISDRATQLLDLLKQSLARDPKGQASGVVRLSFFEKKRKKAVTGFAGFWKESGTNSEGNGICWETWQIKVKSRRATTEVRYGEDGEGQNSDAAALTKEGAISAQRAIREVISLAGKFKDHIPPITSAEANPFPYEVVIDSLK